MRSALALALAAAAAGPARGQDANALLEEATRQAAAAVAASVVRVETAGGAELVGEAAPGRGRPGQQVRKGVGPTTGVVVSPDGYVISSAFNFANKPSDIFVTVPGRERAVAKLVATDQTRMLALLKIDADGLPVPQAHPKAQTRIGQWAVALGRALNPDTQAPPSISAGIVSALDRIWGKAIQTDAKVSPVNYGGPLVAADGRVLGVLVPASPDGSGATAGVEWYDSGIGFAIPFEDVLAALPRLREGKDLKPGMLGIRAESTDLYGEPATIGSVAPESAADRAGLKPGDTVVKVDGHPVANQAQLLHQLRPKYEGDVVDLVVRRGDQEVPMNGVVLAGEGSGFVLPFLGVLPMRDDPEPGVEVRYVFPGSPADAAGLKAGDRLMKLAPGGADETAPFAGRDQFLDLLARFPAGLEIQMEVRRQGGEEAETLKARLGKPSEAVPGELPMPSSKGKALEEPKPVGQKAEKKDDAKILEKKSDKAPLPETGLIRRQDRTLNREYWLYVPQNYDPNVSHGVLIWLHPPGRGGKDADDLVKIWGGFCRDRHFIVVGPQSANETGWAGSELGPVIGHVRDVMGQYTTDPRRVAAHGMGVGGQFAYYMGFNAPELVRGVITTGAVLANQPKEGETQRRLSFFVVAGEQDTLIKDIAEGAEALRKARFPVVYRQLKEFGKEYLDVPTFDELCRWLDSLDRG